MNVEELKKKLSEEGFPHVYEWTDVPGTGYPVHAHKGEVAFYIINGDITFQFGDEEKRLATGDRFDVPVGKEHSAKVGTNGCTFVVGEMVEGDS